MIIFRSKFYSFHSEMPNTLKIQKTGLTLKKTEPLKIARWLGKNLIKSLGRQQDNKSLYEVLDKFENNIGFLDLSKVGNDTVEIVWIEIDRGYRGNHYATSILEEVIKMARLYKVKKLILDVPGISPDAHHIYTKLGFRETGEKEEDDIWGGLTRMEMKL